MCHFTSIISVVTMDGLALREAEPPLTRGSSRQPRTMPYTASSAGGRLRSANAAATLDGAGVGTATV
ncbi:MAG: hypothetical protein F4X58_13380 [Chloroflexi bacterium]|nr:hypothetical protein [Chloroflexota bacterium]MYC02898.1 hypothetical protein [Chloroflexota bacterium]